MALVNKLVNKTYLVNFTNWHSLNLKIALQLLNAIKRLIVESHEYKNLYGPPGPPIIMMDPDLGEGMEVHCSRNM